MKNFLNWVVFFILTVVVCGIAGCASPKSGEEKESVSTLPWNTPQKWEKSTPMGGAMGY